MHTRHGGFPRAQALGLRPSPIFARYNPSVSEKLLVVSFHWRGDRPMSGGHLCRSRRLVKIARLRFVRASLAWISLLSLFTRHQTEASNMKLPAAVLAVFASIVVTVDATVYFKEQFLDEGTVSPIPRLLVSVSDWLCCESGRFSCPQHYHLVIWFKRKNVLFGKVSFKITLVQQFNPWGRVTSCLLASQVRDNISWEKKFFFNGCGLTLVKQ